MSNVLDLCDEWDRLSKGETETTRRIRAAYLRDMAAAAKTAREAALQVRIAPLTARSGVRAAGYRRA